MLTMGLGGVARKLVAKRKDLKALPQLYHALEVVNKRAESEVQNAMSTKQNPDESICDFSARFQASELARRRAWWR